MDNCSFSQLMLALEETLAQYNFKPVSEPNPLKKVYNSVLKKVAGTFSNKNGTEIRYAGISGISAMNCYLILHMELISNGSTYEICNIQSTGTAPWNKYIDRTIEKIQPRIKELEHMF